jgi:hypothetical protein
VLKRKLGLVQPDLVIAPGTFPVRTPHAWHTGALITFSKLLFIDAVVRMNLAHLEINPADKQSAEPTNGLTKKCHH